MHKIFIKLDFVLATLTGKCGTSLIAFFYFCSKRNMSSLTKQSSLNSVL